MQNLEYLLKSIWKFSSSRDEEFSELLIESDSLYTLSSGEKTCSVISF